MRFNRCLSFLFVIFLLVPFTAKSEIITFNAITTSFVEQQKSVTFTDDGVVRDDGPVVRTELAPTEFSVSWDIDFGLPPNESPFWDSMDHSGFLNTFEEDGIFYSVWTSWFAANILNDSPFKSVLQNDFPAIIDMPSSTSQGRGLVYRSIVASDAATGEVVQTNSSESIRIFDSFGFSNDPQDTDYDHIILFNLDLETSFTSAVNTVLSVKEIAEIVQQSGDKFVYNEIAELTDFDPINAALDTRLSGYVGKTTSVTVVSEASTFVLLMLAMLGLLRLRRL